LATLSRHIRNAAYIDWIGNATQAGNLIPQIDPDSYYLSTSTPDDTLTAMAKSNLFGPEWTTLRSLHGCNGAYTNVAALTDFRCATTGATPVSTAQSITVSYQVLSTAAAASSSVGALPAAFDAATGQSGDCNNQNAGAFAINRFYLSNQTLFCDGNGGDAAVPVAKNIEQLVFLFGEAQTTAPVLPAPVASINFTSDMMVGRYLNAGAPPKWPVVTSVQICLVVIGTAGTLAPGTTAANYTDCLGTSTAITDNRPRTTFRTTVSVRNQLRTTP
jgi:hypothetical protein